MGWRCNLICMLK